jgi:hypothetical protein
MRHTFISRLAENPNVSEQSIKDLAGHVSRQKLEGYSHIRSQGFAGKEELLFEQYLENPMDTRMALEIKGLDDQLAEDVKPEAGRN